MNNQLNSTLYSCGGGDSAYVLRYTHTQTRWEIVGAIRELDESNFT